MIILFKKRGFTLIELMVVIAIIGILASIIIVSLSSSRAKGRDAKRVSDIRTIQLALEEYYNDNSSYPTSIYTSPFTPTYLSSVPTDPLTGSAYKYSAYNSAGTSNCVASKPVKYHLAAVTECDSVSGGTSCPTYNGDSDYSGDDSLTACTGSTASFDGNAASCTGTSPALTDNCYDVTN